jgi:lipoprotein-releasing system permease protein
LGTDINNVFSTIELYYANPEQTNFAASPENAYRSLELHPAGMFQISDDFDDKYILAPLNLVQHLFHKDGQYSSLEISVEDGKTDEVKAALSKLIGADYKVESRYEQNKTMFMVLRTEKWAIYAILVMVLLVASFNLIGGLTMMVLEKQKDIAILKAMGAGNNDIKAVFLTEGILWAMSGGISGILLGTLVCVVQQQFGIITVGGSFLMDAYPVDMNAEDFLLVFATILAVGLLAAWYPATKATKAPAPALKGV